jgi:hypothetical protein
MGSFSDYWENKILNHLFGKAALTPPAIYVGLSTANPAENGSSLAEPSGNAYTRVQTSDDDWYAASDGSIDNAGEIVFPMATGSWGTMTHFVLFDAATDGNMLAFGTLSPSKPVGSGDIAKFAAGDLVLSLD